MEDLSQLKDKFDIIFDTVGKTKKDQCNSLLNRNGVYVSVSSGYASVTIQQLEQLKDLFEKAEFKATIDITFFNGQNSRCTQVR